MQVQVSTVGVLGHAKQSAPNSAVSAQRGEVVLMSLLIGQSILSSLHIILWCLLGTKIEKQAM